ncbi:MAG: Gfo/Idh/MocA family oxidoreductase [Clostridiales bacterium]|nr:Gfo/Idh/MocA family oxidoreductase [Clostridiales bacterium]
MKHRIGYIGYGEMGGGYHWQVADDRHDVCDDLAPVAVYDLRECRRETAAERGMKAYDNLEEFLASDEFDIVVVACSNNFHCEMTCRALEAGKHVICEKPAAMSPGEFDKMVETSKKTDRYLFIHQNRRFDRDFLMVKHVIESGRLGKIYNIESTFCGGTLFGWRAFEDHAGGILYDWGVHLLDQLVYLFDEPVKSVYADLRCEKNKEVDDRSVIEMTFKSGVKARVTVAGSFLAPSPRFAVYGDTGVMWVDELYAEKATIRYSRKSEWEELPADVYGKDGAYVRNQVRLNEDLTRVEYPDDGMKYEQDWAKLYKNMLDTIDGNDEMLVHHDQVRMVLRVIEAAFKSSATGEIVHL